MVTHLSSIEGSVIFGVLMLYPVYNIFKRAGLNTRFSVLTLIPFMGLLIVTAILAHSTWTTVPPLKKKNEQE